MSMTKVAVLILISYLTYLVKADVSHLSGIQTILKEDGYHYDKPKIPFPTPPPVVKKPKCSNGAPDSAYPDCCKNGGRGKYCCTNGANTPGCQIPTSRPPPPPPVVKKPLCSNGAPDSAYPDCCKNGGRGQYCCTNGANTPGCQIPTSRPPPPPPVVKKPLCSNGAPDSAYPDCCKNGGRGQYCCTNGANTPGCQIPTRPSTPVTKKEEYLPPPPPPVVKKPLCSNGAPDSSYPDCCKNGGRGQYCCTNGANTPGCQIPTSRPPPPPPVVKKPLCSNGAPDSSYPDCCKNGGRGQYCCTNGANTPGCQIPTSRPPPPPPVVKKPLCSNGAPDSSYPDCCKNGGRGQYCCANGANTPGCQIPTSRPPPSPPVVKKPLCSNGAPDNSYPDCCKNGGRGQYCCTNGANTPGCQIPTSRPPPPPPVVKKPLCSNGAPDNSYPDCCKNGGRGQYCCTNGANTPGCQIPTSRPPPPPPVVKKPLCSNGAPDSSYPDCCKNGGRGQYCCTNGANTPGCQIPTSRPPPPPPVVKKPLCSNGAPDSSYPDCCKNGGRGQYCCTNGANTPGCQKSTSPSTPGYLPPPSTNQVKKPLCSNGAPDSAYPDCCKNGGRGQYCCTNGANTPGCQIPTSRPPPPPPVVRKPLCSNGAPDSSYPDCCKNGGRGQYCCTNGANTPGCQIPTSRPPPPPPVVRKPLCSNGAPDSAYPDCCKNGGRGQYCCTNGANTPGCQIPTRPTTPVTKKEEYLPPPPPPVIRKPLCFNGAPDSSYPDCCKNGGRGQYCCTNGANTPGCQIPTSRPPPPPPVVRKPLCSNGAPDSSYPDCCKNGGRGQYCCTNGANTPGCQIPTSRPPPPPPVVRKPLCSNGAPDSSYPDCCKNGGRGQYCCTNGANTPGCQIPTSRPPPSPPVVRKPLCSNGAPDSAYPDCCKNGGRGQYCCTNGANTPGCQIPTSRPPPPPPVVRKPLCSNGAPDSSYPDCCKNGGRGQYCCTNGANTPGCQIPTSRPPPSPPVVRKPLCSNGAPDSLYPDCCKNGGRGQYCCTNGANTLGCKVSVPPTQKTCGNGGSGPNCDTSSGYSYDKPKIPFIY